MREALGGGLGLRATQGSPLAINAPPALSGVQVWLFGVRTTYLSSPSAWDKRGH